MYLGDGMLTLAPRNVWRLRIVLDQKYPGIIERCASAIGLVASRGAGRAKHPGCIELCSNWKHWRCLFPQHGFGPKHRRPIELVGWQRWIVEQHPRDFVAGLIHSDGCRVINRVQHGRYSYPRYHFSNESGGIRAMFTWACGLVGVDSRPNNRKNISVARRASVAILDGFIGPKA